MDKNLPVEPTPTWVLAVAVVGGVICGAFVLLTAFKLRSWYHKRMRRRAMEQDLGRDLVQKPLGRVTFNLPAQLSAEEGAVFTEVKYLQQDDDLFNLDPEIYRMEHEGEQEPGSPFMGPGRLCFSLRYDETIEKLYVRLIRATRLTPIGENVTSTPYVKLVLLPDKKRKQQSRIHRRTSNPNFYEDFVFSVAPDDLERRTLRFTVCDFDRFSRQQTIGHVMYQLKGVDLDMDGQETDDIWVDINEDETAKEGVNKGQMLFSLQFLPTACRLTLAVLKGRNLRTDAEDNDLDPYVKVSMIINGKTIKKRKTITLKKNSNPVFNEAFSFTITPSCLERVSFVIAAYTAPRLGGSKKMIGRAVTGPSLYSTGPGLAHWNDMLSAPRSAVAHWHNLI